jgi:hypothetical protein
MIPLGPGKGVETSKDTFHPALTSSVVDQESIVVVLLNNTPLLGRETFQEVLPSDLVLSTNCLSNFHGTERRNGQWLLETKLLEAMGDGSLDRRVGLLKVHVVFQLVNVFIPGSVGIFG